MDTTIIPIDEKNPTDFQPLDLDLIKIQSQTA